MIFLDNASTTQISKEALDVYNDYSINYYFNPSALYMKGAIIHKQINEAKQRILSVINGDKFDNIIFTSGATEANNMALRSYIKYKNKKALIGISEHPSVYNVAKNLADNGYTIEYIKITPEGIIDLDDLKDKLTDDVNFVSIMHVNNETGAVNPIHEIAQIVKVKNKNIIVHSDGVQALGKINVDLEDLGVDLYTISSHKIYGPKGIGALYVRKGVRIDPLLLGGGQEMNLRSGTENTPAIFAFTKAIELANSKLQENYDNARDKNKYIKEKISSIEGLWVNSNDNCSPYIVSFSYPHTRAETILRMLEQNNILIGNGSACSSHSRGNRVLSNMGLKDQYIEGSLRVSMSYSTTLDEIDQFITALKDAINEYKNNTNR